MMISNTSGCHCYVESYKCWASILWNIQMSIMQLFPQRKNMSRLAFNPRMPHIWLYQNNRLYSLRRWHPWVIRHYCFSKWQQIIIMKNHIVDNGIPLTYIVHTKIMCFFCLSQKIGQISGQCMLKLVLTSLCKKTAVFGLPLIHRLAA